MSIITTDSKHYNDIARAIREKTGGSKTYTPREMAGAIRGITGGEDLDAVLAEQEALIEGIKTGLAGKAAVNVEVWTITYVDGTVEEKAVATG